MLKVNVGLSRKLSRGYNSTGFNLNLEGEICASMDDPEAIIERVKEFYDLAEEALNQQIERYEAETAIGSHDDQRHVSQNTHSQTSDHATNGATPQNGNGTTNHNRNGSANNVEVATNKQVQYLLNLGKRQGLTHLQLEERIAGIIGKKVKAYDLSKREAGDVIDALSQDGAATATGNGGNRSNR